MKCQTVDKLKFFHFDRVQRAEKSHEISPCVLFTHTKTCLICKLLRAFAFSFRDKYAKSRHIYLVEMGFSVILFLNH